MAFAVVCLGCVATRLVPWVLAPQTTSSDAYFHLAMIARVKEMGWRRAYGLFPGYPLGFHWMLSWLPAGWVRGWERVNGAVFDTLHVVLFTAVLHHFAGDQLPPLVLWVWAPALLALSPGWLYVGAGPRAFQLTERIFSELLASAAFCCLWLYRAGEGAGWLAAAVVLAAVVLNASKFGAQVVLFFCLFLAVLERDPVLALVPLAAGALAWAMGGTYHQVLREQAWHLNWYRKAIRARSTPIARRNSLTELRARHREKGLKGAAEYLAREHSIVIGLLHHPALLATLGVLVFRGAPAGVPPFARSWLVAAVAAWLLTSLRPALFLGEAERYLFYAAVPEYALAALVLGTTAPALLWLVLAYSAAWYLGQMLLVKVKTDGSIFLSDDRARLVSFLNGLPPGRFLGFDTNIMWDLAYTTHHRHWLMSPVGGSIVRYWDQIFSHYPFTKNAAIPLLSPELLVVSHTALERARGMGVEVDFPLHSMPRLYADEAYSVYSLAGAGK